MLLIEIMPINKLNPVKRYCKFFGRCKGSFSLKFYPQSKLFSCNTQSQGPDMQIDWEIGKKLSGSSKYPELWKNFETNLAFQDLLKNIRKHANNFLLTYLNIQSICCNIYGLRATVSKFSTHYLFSLKRKLMKNIWIHSF